MNKLFRKFLEWLYQFDFIEGDLAHAIFYYLHPKEWVEMIEKSVAPGVRVPNRSEEKSDYGKR